jgi:glycosyltransferase involved in cell wall biosynthesis
VRALFVCPFVPWPLDNGGRIRTFHLVREASRHAEIHLRVIREPQTPPDAERALRPFCTSLELFERTPPGRLARIVKPKLERWFHSPDLYASIERDLARLSLSLVHLDELLLTRSVPEVRAVPVVQHHHKLDTVLYDSLSAHEGPRRHFDLWKLRRLEAESCRRTRHHVLCSAEDAALLRARHGALDCAVIPSGFDPDYFRLPEPAHERTRGRITFLGSMNYGPNIEGVRRFVEQVLPRILARAPQAHFEIVGGEPTPEVQSLAGAHVTVTGRVSDVRPHLARAAVFVVPLAIGGGTRLKIVEALAMGAPVVSTTIGAEGLGLCHGEHLWLADRGDDFADAVLRLLEHPAEARALARAGHALVHERFRWEALGNELVDAWERVAFGGKLAPSR